MSAIGTVLCPVDASPLSERALRLAVEMCKRTGARLVLEHNLECRPPNYLGVGWMWSAEHEADERAKKDRATEILEHLFEDVPPGIEYEAKLTRGPVDESLLHVAKLLTPDLIVMGTHGPSTTDHRSLTERIIIKAPCPVLTIGEGYAPESVFGVEGAKPPERLSILVPYDFGSRSRESLQFALAMAERTPHRIHLLHVVESRTDLAGEPERSLDVSEASGRLAALVPDELEDRMTVDVAVGPPVRRIVEAARATNSLFILMGAHGKSPLQRFLFGTTTFGVLHGSDCPVWFIPPAVRRSAQWTAA